MKGLKESKFQTVSVNLARSARSKSTNNLYEREAEKFRRWAVCSKGDLQTVNSETLQLICEYILHKTNNMALKGGKC